MLALATRLQSLLGDEMRPNPKAGVRVETELNAPASTRPLEIWMVESSGRRRGQVCFYSGDRLTKLTFIPSHAWRQAGVGPQGTQRIGETYTRIFLETEQGVDEMERCMDKGLRVWSGNRVLDYLCPKRSE